MIKSKILFSMIIVSIFFDLFVIPLLSMQNKYKVVLELSMVKRLSERTLSILML